jgi:hypothetical protein
VTGALCNARCATAGRPPKRHVTRTGVPLEDGLPLDARLTCFSCSEQLQGCPARFECAQCLEIFRARALALGTDGACANTPLLTVRCAG